MNIVEQPPCLPAHYEQAEWMLLASLIELPEILPSVDMDLFYVTECQMVLDAIASIKRSGNQIDWPEVSMKLTKTNPDVFLKMSTACDQLPSPHNWSYWLDILKEFRAARRTAALSIELSEASSLAGTGINPNLTGLSTKLKDIINDSALRGPRSIGQILPSVIDRLEQSFNDPKSLYGVCTSFEKLDMLTYGLQPGSLNVIAARPTMGKTAFACNVALAVALEGKPVAFFSLETSEVQISDRILASMSEVAPRRFANRSATHEDFKKVTVAQARLAKSPLHIYDSISDIADICGEVSQAVSRHGVKLVIIDYLQRIQMRSCKEGHFARVGAVSNALKDMAMEFKVPVLALAQLSREVEKDNRKPMLSDLRDSGQIEQDADVIGFLWQDEKGKLSLFVLKNRNGPIGRVGLDFNKEITKFQET